MGRLSKIVCSLVLLAGLALADGVVAPKPGYELQYDAHLKNGFSIRHCSHETVGSMTRLWITPGQSYVDVASDEINDFEAVEVPLPPPPVVAAPAVQPARDLSQVVSDAGQRTRIDPDFIHSVIRAESGGNPQAVSPKGARGLMQLMPQTAAQ